MMEVKGSENGENISCSNDKNLLPDNRHSCESRNGVTPANAGVHNSLGNRDSRFHGNDKVVQCDGSPLP